MALGGHKPDPARLREISTSFVRADVERRWRAEDPARANLSPDRLTGADLARYKSWETTTLQKLSVVDRQAALDVLTTRQLGFATAARGGGSGSPPFIADAPSDALYKKLSGLVPAVDPVPRQGFGVGALPEARAIVRRSAHDLPTVLDTLLASVQASVKGPMAAAYLNEPTRPSFEGAFGSAKDALRAWTSLVSSSDQPDRATLDRRARECGDEFVRIMATGNDLIYGIEKMTGAVRDALPGVLGDGVLLYVGALAEEVGTQYAARVAEPSFGLMYARICENPDRDATTATASAQRENPKGAMDLLSGMIERAKGDGNPNVKPALTRAADAADFKVLAAAWVDWRKQLGRVPGQDMTVMRNAVLTLMFRLERLRSDVAAGLRGTGVYDYVLAPIDGLVALMQKQADDAQRLLG